MDILNFLQIDANIASSGQPSVEQFTKISDLGYKTVVNLAMPTSDNALENEGKLVTQTGMNYVHIAVIWESPHVAQYLLFETLMNAHQNSLTWVHCALNMPVSCFIYLYFTRNKAFDPEQAYRNVTRIWSPNETWISFIKEVEQLK